MLSEDAARIATHCRQVLPLAEAKLSAEYGYVSLPHCVIDSVFSIGVRYEGVKNVIARYDAFLRQQRIAHASHTIEEMLGLLEPFGMEGCAEQIFVNRQRISTRNGILKAEAVLLFAQTLKKHDVQHRAHASKLLSKPEFEEDIRAIPGQSSGISLKYFFMLVGEMDYIKPDRMIYRFLENALKRSLKQNEPENILRAASLLLQAEYPHLKPALLDHEIWKHQRERGVALL